MFFLRHSVLYMAFCCLTLQCMTGENMILFFYFSASNTNLHNDILSDIFGFIESDLAVKFELVWQQVDTELAMLGHVCVTENTEV